uniref:Uncharacterized protein n=1 Tax=Lutzomyia longipalpis TaxID=7200 RepID=A0A1B0C8A7_LUTLO
MADVIKNSMDRTGSEHKNHLQKSKSVENDSSTYFGSIDHYPALEKTVKSKTILSMLETLDDVHSLPVESSTGLSLGLTTIPSAASSSTPPQASYADIARIANSNSIEQKFQLKDNWPAMPLRHTSGNQHETMETASTNSGSTTASYKSQNSVVHRSVPSTGSNTSQTSPPASMVAIATDAAAAAAASDDAKNLAIAGGGVQIWLISGSINCSANVSPNLAVKVSPVEQLKSPALVSSVNRCDVPRNGGASAQVAAAATVAPTTTTTTVNNNPAALNEDGNGGMTSSPGVVMPTKSHRGKKNDQKSGHQEDANATTARLGGGSSTSRPAVIILNDNDRYQLNEGITFGFDINNQLLFGDFNENELHLLEASSTSSSVPPTHNSCASSVTSSGQTATDTGYASNASTVASSEGHDTTLDTNNSSVQSASDATVSDQNFNHTLDDFMQVDEMEKCCDPMPILKACVSVQTSMEHLYINDAQPPSSSSSSSVVRLEERDSSIIASIPAQIAFTDSESNNNIIQMLSPSARICGKKLNVRYVAPAEEELILTTYNHDKIVSFVGLAWENVAGNDGVKYYDGQ